MHRAIRRGVVGFSLAALMAACQASTPTQQVPPTVALTVSVAASLQDVMKAIEPLYEQQSPHIDLVYNFGSSGSLQNQIEQGAPVDVFISAAPKQMDALEKKDFLREDTRKNLLTNQVVSIALKDRNNISQFQDLAESSVQKIAIGDPESVPAGQYAREVLTTFKLYEKLTPKFVFAKDVRQVLSYVETGNVDAGLVYATDAKVSALVRVVATAPKNSHSPIIYPVAAIRNSQHSEEAISFIQYLFSQSASEIFKKYGFTTSKNE